MLASKKKKKEQKKKKLLSYLETVFGAWITLSPGLFFYPLESYCNTGSGNMQKLCSHYSLIIMVNIW